MVEAILMKLIPSLLGLSSFDRKRDTEANESYKDN